MILAAGTTGTILATVVAFLVTSLLLISVLLFVKQKLSPSGPVKILINGEREIEVASGATLLSTLVGIKYFYLLLVVVVEPVFNVSVMCSLVGVKPCQQKHLTFQEKSLNMGPFIVSSKGKTRYGNYHSRRSLWN